MKNKLDNGFQLQQTNVTRVGRRIMLTGGVDESSIHEIMKLLFEIQNEDDEVYGQEKYTIAFEEFVETLGIKQTNQTIKNKNLNKVGEAIDKFQTENTYDRDPIEFYISSYGGDGYEVLGVIDMIRNMKAPVYTYLFGKAMSAGFLMFMVGDKRYISRNSTLMDHQLSGRIEGTYQDMCEQLQEYQRMQEQVEDLIMLHTYLTQDDLDDIRERKYDCYINAEQAIELGIADEII